MIVLLIDDELTTRMEKVPSYLRAHPKIGDQNHYSFGEVDLLKEWLAKYPFEADIIIIDHFLGDDKGTDLGAWINKQYPHIVCILLTGGGDEEENKIKDVLLDIATEALEAGFCSFLLKSRVTNNQETLHGELDRILLLPSVQAKFDLKLERRDSKVRLQNLVKEINDISLLLPYDIDILTNDFALVIQTLDHQEAILQLAANERIELNGDSLGFAIVLREEGIDINSPVKLSESGNSNSIINTIKLPQHIMTIAEKLKIKTTYKKRADFRALIQNRFKFEEKGRITDNGLGIYRLLQSFPDRWLITRKKAKERGTNVFATFIDNIIKKQF